MKIRPRLPSALRGFTGGVASFAGWIRRVAVRQTLMHLRGGRRRREASVDGVASLVAREIRPEWYGGDARARPRQAVDVADSLKRHFPRHPAGWAFSRAYGVSKGRFDLLRFFQSAERKYASMDETLWPAKALDAERLHDMVVFAHDIDEPGEMLRWSARLVEEHPEDPRALADLTGALHQIELRMPPALDDSIRRWLPALDRAYRAGPVPNEGFDEALRLAVSYGDSATKALWVGRSGANDGPGNIRRLMRRAQHPARAGVVEELRARADRGCALPAGRLPLSQTIAGWRILCERHRGMVYGYLARRRLDAGRAQAALADADSAIAALRRGQLCTPLLGHFAHGYASLALGDTATAETDFVLGLAGYPPKMTRMMDTVRSHLGPRFVEERYLARRTRRAARHGRA